MRDPHGNRAVTTVKNDNGTYTHAITRMSAEEWLATHRNHRGQIVEVRHVVKDSKPVSKRRYWCDECRSELVVEAIT